MYLDILGPSVTGGHPSPPKARRFHQPRLPTEPFEVDPGGVYSPSCRKRVHSAGGGSCPGGGGVGGRGVRGGEGVPSSFMRLFIWEPEWPFLWLLLNVLYRPNGLVPQRGAGITHTPPTARHAHLARAPWCTWLSEKPWAQLSLLLAPSFSRGLVTNTDQDQNHGLPMLVLLLAFATITGK